MRHYANLSVDAVEPSLPFRVDRLGFEKTAEVPGGDGLVFAILNLGGGVGTNRIPSSVVHCAA
jgi:hypothetical protein